MTARTGGPREAQTPSAAVEAAPGAIKSEATSAANSIEEHRSWQTSPARPGAPVLRCWPFVPTAEFGKAGDMPTGENAPAALTLIGFRLLDRRVKTVLDHQGAVLDQ